MWSCGKFSILLDVPVTPLIWLDADQITGIADAAAVTTWSDLSGNGNDFAQAVAGAKPTYRTNVLNGHPVVRFDGSNDYMTVTGLTADASFTFITVAKKVSAVGADNKCLWSMDAGNHFAFTDSDVHATGYLWWSNQAAGTTANFWTTATTWHTLTARVNSAASVDCYTDGGVAVNLDPHDVVTTSTAMALGAGLDGSSAGDYDVAEVLVYSSALSAANLNLVGLYLARKYALTWTAVA